MWLGNHIRLYSNPASITYYLDDSGLITALTLNFIPKMGLLGTTPESFCKDYVKLFFKCT